MCLPPILFCILYKLKEPKYPPQYAKAVILSQIHFPEYFTKFRNRRFLYLVLDRLKEFDFPLLNLKIISVF